jgi:chorismate dehydratase
MPFLYGLKNHEIKEEISVELDHPGDCANKLIKKEVDLGLIPVAALSMLDDYEIVSDFCIGSTGAVDSVVLLSNVPLQDIEAILLDYQSITSVKLLKILCDRFWNITPKYKSSYPGFEKSIDGSDAAVVIGDRAMQIKGRYKFVYDLAESWYSFTGLPFVFACWVSNRPLKQEFKDRFNQALGYGINHINDVIDAVVKSGKYSFDVESYLTENLSFQLTNNLIEGMDHFLALAKEYDKIVIDR